MRKAGARALTDDLDCCGPFSTRSRSWWLAGVRGGRVVLGDETLALLLGFAGGAALVR
jgi:hypothetical protein